MKSYVRSKRPLSYLGNSDRTKRRKKKIGMLDAEKNGNTLDRFFFTEKNIQMNENNMNSHNDLIEESNAIEINFMEYQKYEDEIEKIDELLSDPPISSNGYKVRLKALQNYFKLLNQNRGKLDASNIVAQLLNKGPWFSRCVRSWAKSFMEFGNIPQGQKGKHLVGSLLDDEDIQIKISSYLRKEKFNVTVEKFRQFITNDVFPSIGIENLEGIRFISIIIDFIIYLTLTLFFYIS
jgi:hypothetical protein